MARSFVASCGWGITKLRADYSDYAYMKNVLTTSANIDQAAIVIIYHLEA